MSMEDKLIKTAIHPEHGRGTIIKETDERLFVKWEDSDHPSGWFMRTDMEYVVVEAENEAILPITETPDGFGITIPDTVHFDLNLLDQTDPPIISPNSIIFGPDPEDEATIIKRLEDALRDDSHEALKDDEGLSDDSTE